MGGGYFSMFKKAAPRLPTNKLTGGKKEEPEDPEDVKLKGDGPSTEFGWTDEYGWEFISKTAVVRYGFPINENGAVTLTTPPAPPPPDAAELAERTARDKADTAAIAGQIDRYMDLVRLVNLFSEMGDDEIESAARALQVKHFKAGETVYDEGSTGSDCWIIEDGEVVMSVLIPGIRFCGTLEWKETRSFSPGRGTCFFGERGLVRKDPRPARMVCRTDVKALRVMAEDYVACARIREYKENLIRGVRLFEQMTDDEVGKLAAGIKKHHFARGEIMMKQGSGSEEGFFLVESGEALSKSSNGTKAYKKGEIFGEQALYGDKPREMEVVADSDVSVYTLSREEFEARLGPLSELERKQFAADPRKLISDFYKEGDVRGPAGTLAAQSLTIDVGMKTSWFAVYRPCSRDSIAKMLGRVGVGKGLNIKGKSAKKNRLSGFVPWLQISEEKHKQMVEESPKDARSRVYFRNVVAREAVVQAMMKILKAPDHGLQIADPQIEYIETYVPKAFGLDVPEPLMKETFIMRADISPIIGWETGRPSVPQFMDANLHATRGRSTPEVVVYQYDLSDPMNPAGLLMAYAEKEVKPVVSDFDTFTIGSRGITYEDMPANQLELLHWSLDRTGEIVHERNTKGWTGHWLDMLKVQNEAGFHPDVPQYGFGDPTSYGFIKDVVEVTRVCGAVRHGAECFNFYFPQELDDEFLVIWDGFAGKGERPWKPHKEAELRQFLLERIKEGYSFPLNPVWPVRDPGWHDVLEALKRSKEAAPALKAWYPPESAVLEKISQLHAQYPGGFAKD